MCHARDWVRPMALTASRETPLGVQTGRIVRTAPEWLLVNQTRARRVARDAAPDDREIAAPVRTPMLPRSPHKGPMSRLGRIAAGPVGSAPDRSPMRRKINPCRMLRSLRSSRA